MKDYIAIPSKETNLISLLLATIRKSVDKITHEVATHEVSLEQLILPRALNIQLLYEVWNAYLQDKAIERGQSSGS